MNQIRWRYCRVVSLIAIIVGTGITLGVIVLVFLPWLRTPSLPRLAFGVHYGSILLLIVQLSIYPVMTIPALIASYVAPHENPDDDYIPSYLLLIINWAILTSLSPPVIDFAHTPSVLLVQIFTLLYTVGFLSVLSGSGSVLVWYAIIQLLRRLRFSSITPTRATMEKQIDSSFPGFTKSCTIRSPIAVVFALLSDLPRLGACMELVDRVEVLSKQRKGLGTRARWVKKASASQPTVSWIEEVTVYEPPTRIGFATIGGERRIRGVITLEPVSGTHTRVVFHEEFLYPNPDLPRHSTGMDNQLASMKKCLETTS